MRRLALVGLLLTLGIGVAGSDRASAQTQDDLFNDDSLQEMRLTLSARDWAALKENYLDNTYYAANLTWRGVTVRNLGIRSRGNGTRNDVKPGIRLDFNRFLTNQTFMGLKALALDNEYSDDSLVREAVTMKMFAKMGIPPPREMHLRLYVNNEYAGVYTAIESVDRDFVTRLYGVDEANVETGGFLFEYSHIMPWNFEYLGEDLAPYAALFEAQTRDTDAMPVLFTPIEEMIRVINESPDEDFADAVGQYLDLPRFMKHLAVESFMAEWDGIVGFDTTNNFYLYRFRTGSLSQLIPWDKDRTFYAADLSVTTRFDTNVLVRRAMQVPALRQAFYEALAQCVAFAQEPDPNDPRGWLEREVDRQTQQVAPAVAEDPVYPFPREEFATAVAFLLDFARTRASFVTCEMGNTLAPLDNDPTSCTTSPASALRFTH